MVKPTFLIEISTRILCTEASRRENSLDAKPIDMPASGRCQESKGPRPSYMGFRFPSVKSIISLMCPTQKMAKILRQNLA